MRNLAQLMALSGMIQQEAVGGEMLRIPPSRRQEFGIVEKAQGT